MNIYEQIERLIQYGLQKKLITLFDVDYVRNQLVGIFTLDGVEATIAPLEELDSPQPILDQMLDWCYEKEILKTNTITYRDLLDTQIMDCLMPRPSEVIHQFQSRDNVKEATDYFYQLSQNSYYIRKDRIAKNEHWYSETEYGDLEITINLAKPEKDPKAIAAAKGLKQSTYPKCLLCKENVGYWGRVNHPARQNHRIIPVTLSGEDWYFQYSPYVYYNEHAILFSKEHKPMAISKEGFDRLLHFVEQYPHYFAGTNADLPIVGGSILSHDHFQGGNHEFPMAIAEIEESFSVSRYANVEVGIVRWPMSVIRLRGADRHEVSALAEEILMSWRNYSDESVSIYAFTNDEPHNTITPIVRFKDGKFEMDLVLRNNRTDEAHPLGIFHPHDEVHHIKQENIGLIEVMGLAVLPGRLQEEMAVLATYMLQEDFATLASNDERTKKHVEWATEVKGKYQDLNEETIYEVLKLEIGHVFSVVLEHAGVYKRTEEGKAAFIRFVRTVQDK
ncbi:UDP-glucose--hexose-1-phosphate uridylyltransferase [Halalkalibacter kiskunsagensis]|uniref:Galactose-1-phosphate uridylyltransferase n=1 Tax=Halalkalibacter kiskunsagensis TaxID=1548599 RepID=A0ABV6KFG5_9BACI